MKRYSQKRRALFPISIGNNLFSTKNTTNALLGLAAELDIVYFLIADEIPVYNKTQGIHHASDFDQIALSYPKLRELYRNEKQKWLKKLVSNVFGIKNTPQFKILNTDTYYDYKFFSIYRNLLLLHSANSEFRNDIVRDVKMHYSGRKRVANSKQVVQLSTYYIVEEIALNIRVRYFNRIYDEYYLGAFPRAMTNIYSGKYGISVDRLVGVNSRDGVFNFYEADFSSENCVWNIVSM